LKINLESKRLCIFGLPGEGKSNLLCWLISRYGSRAFIYDTMHEYPDDQPFDVYRPADRYSVPEMEKVLKLVVKLAGRKRYKLVAIDEASRFAPSKPHPLPQILGEINDCCRHIEYNNLTPVFIARRPTQLNQDLTELAHYLIIFNLKGKNDIDYLESFAAGLGEVVFHLKPFHFVLVNQRREFTIFNPVPEMPMLKKTNSGRTPLQTPSTCLILAN